jgi:hypothetical protein
MHPENIYSQKSHRFLAQEKGEMVYTQINDIAGIFASFAPFFVFLLIVVLGPALISVASDDQQGQGNIHALNIAG